MHSPFDLGIIGRQLRRHFARSVEPVDVKAGYLSFQGPGPVLVIPCVKCGCIDNFRADEVTVEFEAVPDPSDADRGMDCSTDDCQVGWHVHLSWCEYERRAYPSRSHALKVIQAHAKCKAAPHGIPKVGSVLKVEMAIL